MFKDFIDSYEDTQADKFEYGLLNTVDDMVHALSRRVKRFKLVTGVDMEWLSHRQREEVADLLTDSFLVQVNRFGTGNAAHSGVLPMCGVASIHIRRRK